MEPHPKMLAQIHESVQERPLFKMAAYSETARTPDISLPILTMNETECTNTVELGFVEKPEKSWKLQSKYFPSKVGGKPAWLNLKDLPHPSELQCKICDGPMILLLQIYAPVDELEFCFHRTIFVFFCKNPNCCRDNCVDNFAVFRSQLARQNVFYSFQPPIDDDDDDDEEDSGSGPSAHEYCHLCHLCGCLGPKRCSRCRTAYCSVQHQRIDWKNGHKSICKDGVNVLKDPNVNRASSYLLPEYEVVIEPEKPEASDTKQKERTEEERLKDYATYIEKVKGMTEEVSSEKVSIEDMKDLQNMAYAKMDKQFQKFRRRLECDPDQILRYQKGGTPLWISSENIPKADEIPNCTCGATRQFEFQILPQLLNHLQLDDVQQSIDWGTLVIYTCTKNCESENEAYKREFILKQDVHKEGTECKQ